MGAGGQWLRVLAVAGLIAWQVVWLLPSQAHQLEQRHGLAQACGLTDKPMSGLPIRPSMSSRISRRSARPLTALMPLM